MTTANATVLAATIAVLGVLVSAGVSLLVANATARGKLNELKQAQIGDIISKRIDHYPSLWQLCQQSIAYTTYIYRSTHVTDGWASKLSDELEAWHAKYGAFLSQESYEALGVVRAKCREYAVESDTAVAAGPNNGPLSELEKIWREGFVYEEKQHYPLSTCLKKDLGSYAQAALSQQ